MKREASGFSGAGQTGVSLIELMLGLALELLLAAGIITIVLAGRQTYRLNEAVSQLQENGRYASSILKSEVTMAGYSGCFGDLSSGVENLLNDSANVAWDLTNPIRGFNNVASNDTIAGITGFTAGTDVLLIKRMGDELALAAPPDANTFTIDAANANFAEGEILLASSCDRASLFQATGVITASDFAKIFHAPGGGMLPGNRSGSIDNQFGNDAVIGRLQTRIYYLRNGANGRPALYQGHLQVTGGTTTALQGEELVRNVENMQMVFGVDTDGDRDADVYQDASTIMNWRDVVSVSIVMLLSSEEDNLVEGKQSYSFNPDTFDYDRDDTPTAMADRRVRHVFSSFSAIRNRTM